MELYDYACRLYAERAGGHIQVSSANGDHRPTPTSSSADGGRCAAIELLRQANRQRAERHARTAPGAAALRRVRRARPAPGFDRLAACAVADLDRGGPAHIPEVTRDELDADVAAAQHPGATGASGRGLLDASRSVRFVAGIEAALAAPRHGPGRPQHAETSRSTPRLPLPRDEAKTLGRQWVAGSGGVLGVRFAEAAQRPLRDLRRGRAARRAHRVPRRTPGPSANKCTLRRVPLTANTDWHQDGAFLGEGIRALNVWVALSDCGVDSPGIDLVPRRFDEIVETGTGGRSSTGRSAPTSSRGSPWTRRSCARSSAAGDALLFDDLFLHRTALDPAMTRPRYAIESWFFAPSAYPDGQVPLVW